MIKCIIFDFLNVLYPDPDGSAHEVVKLIKDQGYQAAGISNLPLEPAKRIADDYQLTDFYVSAELGMSKTEMAIYEYFLAQHDYLAENCLMIDDNIENLLAPKQLGINTVWLNEACSDRVDYCVKTIRELPRILENLA